MHALVPLCINQHTKFKVSSFTNSKDMIGTKFKKTGHWLRSRILGNILSSKAKHLIIFYLHTKFGHCGFRRSGYMISGVDIVKWFTWHWPRPFMGGLSSLVFRIIMFPTTCKIKTTFLYDPYNLPTLQITWESIHNFLSYSAHRQVRIKTLPYPICDGRKTSS